MNGETWAEIRRLKAGEGLAVSEISRRLMLDRKTVRAALRSETCPAPGRISRPSKLDTFKPYIQNRVKQYPGINCVRLLGELGHDAARQRAARRLEAFVAADAGKRLGALRRLEAALLNQDLVAIKEATGKLKGPYSKLFAKFG